MHHSVMLEEAISSLNLEKGDCILDATLGGGGHAHEILKRITPGGRLVGIDADPEAIKIAESKLQEFSGSFKLVNGNFRDLDAILLKEGIREISGCIFDVGISSFQMDNGSRGFSIKENARLDMRMNPLSELSAYDVVNKYREQDISDIIKNFGEERFSNRIARYIVTARASKPIETTHDLALIVHKAVGGRFKRGRIDPATRTFQAIRIFVNDELGAMEEGLKKAVSWLGIGARICVISFHSLEDRIAKNLFKGYSDLGVLKVITKKPVRPSGEEMVLNPRARSGRLRVAERIS